MDKKNMKRLPDQVSLCSTRPAMTNILGRSMVEMLGVLAIIGVLSVGALAGFNKAMMKHKLNKQAEQLNSLLMSVLNHTDDFRDVSGAITSYIISFQELSQDMIVNGNIYDTFQINYSMARVDRGNSELITIWITPTFNLSENAADNFEICKNIFSVVQAYHENVGWFYNYSYDEDDHARSDGVMYGDMWCQNGRKCLKDATTEDIYTLCTGASGQSRGYYKLEIQV